MRGFKPEIAINLLDEAGFLQPNTLLNYYVESGIRRGDFSELEAFLDRHRGILAQAKMVVERKKAIENICPFAPFPKQEDFDEDNIVPLGIMNVPQKYFCLSEEDLVRHTLVCGQTGFGKSNMIKVFTGLLLEFTDATVWHFDPKKDYRDIAKHHDYLIIRVKNLCQNIFEPPKMTDPWDWAQEIAEAIQTEARFQTRSKYLLLTTIKKLYEQNGVFEGSENYPTVSDVLIYLRKKRQSLQNSKEKVTFNEIGSYEMLINRFENFENVGMFNVKKSVPIEILTNRNVIFELDNAMSEDYTLIMSCILAKAYCARLNNESEREKLLLVNIEEARKPMSAKKERDYAVLSDPYLVTMMTKCRSSNIGFIVVTHEPSSISAGCRANVFTSILMNLHDGDQIMAGARSLGLNKKQTEYYRKLEIGQAICSYSGKGAEAPFLIDIPLYPFPKDPPTEEEIEANVEKFFRSINYKRVDVSSVPQIEYKPAKPKPSTEKLPEPTKSVDEKEKPEPPKDEMPVNCVVMLDFLGKHPFTKYTDVNKGCELHPDKGIKAREWLEDNGYIIIHKDIKTSLRQKGILMQLTEKALEKVKAKKIRGKGSFKHKAYCHYIAAFLEREGKKPKIEAYLNGKHIDVLCDDIAYEVTVHMDNIIENIEKDLKAGAKKVVIVTEETKRQKKAQSIVKKHPELMKSTEFDIIGNFFPTKKEAKK